MTKYSVRKYPDFEMQFPFKETGKTNIVTSYTTFTEQAKHKPSSGCKVIGTDIAVEGPKKKPIMVYRVFERCKKR